MGEWIPLRAIPKHAGGVPDLFFKLDGFNREKRDDLVRELEQSGYYVQEIFWADPMFMLTQARIRKEMEKTND